MKIFKKIVDAIKWRFIIAIDRKYPEACWFNLVMWYQGGYTTKEMFGSEESRWNTRDCNTVGAGAYCGKCSRTGRISKKKPIDIEVAQIKVLEAQKDLTEVLTKGFVI